MHLNGSNGSTLVSEVVKSTNSDVRKFMVLYVYMCVCAVVGVGVGGGEVGGGMQERARGKPSADTYHIPCLL